MAGNEAGAARTRLSTRESFFGGPLSTREQSKAPGWQAFVKPKPEKEAAAPQKQGGRSSGKARAGQAAGPPQQRAAEPQPDTSGLRLQKLKQRRDFSGLGSDSAPPPPPRQQTAAGPPPAQCNGATTNGYAAAARQRAAAGGAGYVSGSSPQQQQQQQQRATAKRAAGGGGGGKKAVAARGMAVEVTAAGKGRKQLASDALKQRVGQMISERSGGERTSNGSGRSAAAAGLGSPSGSASGGGASAAAAAAARSARQAATAKGVMLSKQYKSATGMQTLQLVSRAPAKAGAAQQQQQRGAARGGGGGGAGMAAMRATGAGRTPPGSSPGSVTKGQRPATGAGAPRAMQRGGAAGGAAGGRPQFRGAFYGGQQPPAALEARMQYNKRRLSLDSGADLASFIASDDEGGSGLGSDGGGGGEEDWRAALREATGGYDPSKFAAIDRQPDRDMEAAWGQIQAEERRAARIARTEDQREAEREALAEEAKRERKRRKKGGASAFVDDD
ncbi:hypothetical protein ACK3TF_004944 [Chlorella vulgaris]